MSLNLLFDTIIFSGIAILLLLEITLVFVVIKGSQSLKSTSIFFIIFCTSILAILIYGSFIEPYKIGKTYYNLEVDKLDNIKIVFLTDFHLGPYKKDGYAKKIVEEVNQLNPDLIFLGGDYIYLQKEEIDYLYPIKDLEAKYGVYGILGNHDYHSKLMFKFKDGNISQSTSEYVINKLKESNVKMITDNYEESSINGQSLIITDLGGIMKNPDLYEKNIPIILLTHNPDAIMYQESEAADIIITGHTHGGQIRFPFVGPLLLPTEISREYDNGLFELSGNRQLIISKGLGEYGPRARLLCNPEIVVINIS